MRPDAGAIEEEIRGEYLSFLSEAAPTLEQQRQLIEVFEQGEALQRRLFTEPRGDGGVSLQKELGATRGTALFADMERDPWKKLEGMDREVTDLVLNGAARILSQKQLDSLTSRFEADSLHLLMMSDIPRTELYGE